MEKYSKKMVARLSTLGNSVADEAEKDAIYERLEKISDQIEARHARDGAISRRMGDMYRSINNGQSLPNEYREVDASMVNHDAMFKTYPEGPRTHLFMKALCKDVGVKRGSSRSMLKQLAFKCDRTPAVNKCLGSSCAGCWKSVMPHVMQMTMEMVTVEMKVVVDGVRTSLEKGEITREDAVHILELIDRRTAEMGELVGKRPTKKSDWVRMLEGVYGIMIRIFNEVTARQVQAAQANHRSISKK